jgi:hypothetical protein
MGTRAVYTFKDRHESFSVYKHYDGYPTSMGAGTGALGFIQAAKEFAWDLPRFEASDFAAAFIAANKQPGGGDVYMTKSYKDHMDLEYRYEIEANEKKLFVKIYQVEEYNDDQAVYKLIEEMNI